MIVCIYNYMSVYHLDLHPHMGGGDVKVWFVYKTNLLHTTGLTKYYNRC